LLGLSVSWLAAAGLLFAPSHRAEAAEVPPTLWLRGQNCGNTAEIYAGTCGFRAFIDPSGQAQVESTGPRGLAVDPDNGHIYASDQQNDRIDEFTAWGEFVKAWGWGVRTGASQLETCTAETGCRRGLSGAGAGELNTPQGVAVAANGDVYVVDWGALRVQKFNSRGEFLLMFGGSVNKTKAEEAGSTAAERNVCRGGTGDVCQAGISGSGSGEFSALAIGSTISLGPDGLVYVGGSNRIQAFDQEGTYMRQIALPEPGQVGALAVDPGSGEIYFSYKSPKLGFPEYTAEQPDVYRLDSSGGVLGTLEVGIPTAIAVAPDGTVDVVDEEVSNPNYPPRGTPPHGTRILRFEPSGSQILAFAEGDMTVSTGIAAGSACYEPDYGLYVSNADQTDSFVRAFGGPPDKTNDEGKLVCEPPKVPPSIGSQFALSVGTDEATIKAEINPHFFPDTSYYVEYGSQPCSEGGCNRFPEVGAESLDSGPVDSFVTVDGVTLSGLRPDTTYHYRFVAESEGGGPVVGRGGSVGLPGAEGTFTTFPLPTPAGAGCANRIFRQAASAALPDCRAFEMVSPVDKAGGDVAVRLNVNSTEPASLDQAALSGEKLTYSSYRAFAAPESAPFSSQYLAMRGAGGWASEALTPPQEGEEFKFETKFDVQFKAFSSDLASGWIYTDTEPILAPGGRAGFANLYRRQSASGQYEACTTTEPTISSRTFSPELLGFAEDGDAGVFIAPDQLTPEANPREPGQENANRQVYECADGQVHLVSVLPDGTANATESVLGSDSIFKLPSKTAVVDHAVSGDGSRVFWTANPPGEGVSGQFVAGSVYVRINALSDVSSSGECAEPAPTAACTLQVSESVTSDPSQESSRFWAATPSGSRCLFEVAKGPLAGNLYLFDVDAALQGGSPLTLVAEGSEGVVGQSEDLRRIYFLSSEQIDGQGVNGQPNLYLYDEGEGGSTRFIATLGQLDGSSAAGNGYFSPVHLWPVRHTAQVTPGGSALSFTSSSSELAEAVAGYDNTDASSGKSDVEVYLYRAAADSLSCLSCTRTGARPEGREVQQDARANPANPSVPESLWAAAMVPPWITSMYAPRALAEDGSRMFFVSYTPLSPTDENTKADVYEWELLGVGDCLESESGFDPKTGGCLNLISTGRSADDSIFLDASSDGRDVFFTTSQSLVGQDPGAIDVYDARSEGGFPEPPAPPSECAGEGCRSVVSPPAGPLIGSSAASAGNPVWPKAHCHKGRRLVRRHGHRRCVKKRRHPARHRHRRHRHSHAGARGRVG